MRTLLVLAGAASANALVVGGGAVAPARATVQMAGEKSNNTPAKYYPQGPFGGFAKPGSAKEGVLGDNSKSVQVGKFEDGSDFLFFQGPAPKTAVQEDLPGLFTAENLAEAQFDIRSIVFAGTGLASLAAVGSILVQ